jgi:hypothetical protein
MIAAVADAIDYAVPGPLTDLASVSPSALEHIPSEPVDVCRPAHTLVIQPSDAKALDLPNDRFSENQLRPAAALLGALLALDPAPLDVPRGPDLRVIGTCRHFAVLSCALLRYRGIAAPGRVARLAAAGGGSICVVDHRGEGFRRLPARGGGGP